MVRYFLNILMDTTVGVGALWCTLLLLNRLAMMAGVEGVKSGYYGHPPKVVWWLKQSGIYFVGLIVMKLLVWLVFALLPWLEKIAAFLLSWSNGHRKLEVAFVMFVSGLVVGWKADLQFFPLVMNALQYYIIDSFIKDKTANQAAHAEPESQRTTEEESFLSDHEFEDRTPESSKILPQPRLSEDKLTTHTE